MILNIFDADDSLLDSSDDYIGRAVIRLHKMEGTLSPLSFDDRISYPAWYPVKREYDDQYDKETGAAVLASFQLVKKGHKFPLNAEDIALNEQVNLPSGNQRYPMPDLDINEFKCEIMVLGLRNLRSTGLLPVRKAYV